MLSSGETYSLVTPLSSMIQLSTQYQAAPIPPSPTTETTLEFQSPEETSETGNLKTYLSFLLDWRIAHSMSKMLTKSDGRKVDTKYTGKAGYTVLCVQNQMDTWPWKLI